MNQPSIFQTQNPLSPKKFWKKVLSRVVFNLIYSVVLALPLTYAVYAVFYNIYSNPSDFGGTVAVIGIGVILGLFLLITCIYALYVKVYIKRYYYDCTDQFVTIKKGVFAPTEIHVQYQKIQDVYVDQDILDRIMGLYDVHIASATVTSGIEAHIDGVNAETAESIKNYLLHRIQGGNNTPASNTAPQPESQARAAATPAPAYKSSTKVSSETYPISGSWTIVALISSFWYSVFIVLFFGFMIRPLFELNFGNITVVAGIAVFVVLWILRFVWTMIWKSNYYFELMPDYILLRTGVISRSENHLPYRSIQNINNNQSLFERILGLGTVVVQNAAQMAMPSSRGRTTTKGVDISFIGQPKAKADELNEILNNIVSSQGNTSGTGL